MMPIPQRTPLATLSNTARPKEHIRKFGELDSETDEEDEEPVESRPAREVSVKLEKETPMKRKGKQLDDHISSAGIVSSRK
jgi:hypothetical protein